jgi:hypothetical protein
MQWYLVAALLTALTSSQATPLNPSYFLVPPALFGRFGHTIASQIYLVYKRGLAMQFRLLDSYHCGGDDNLRRCSRMQTRCPLWRGMYSSSIILDSCNGEGWFQLVMFLIMRRGGVDFIWWNCEMP